MSVLDKLDKSSKKKTIKIINVVLIHWHNCTSLVSLWSCLKVDYGLSMKIDNVDIIVQDNLNKIILP